jgi:hypothetical protein
VKVVVQLVEYLYSRGTISWQDILQLEQTGFVSATQLRYANYPGEDEEPYDPADFEPEPDPTEELLPQKVPPPRHRSSAKTAQTTLAQLDAWLKSSRLRWAPDLQALLTLAEATQQSKVRLELVPQVLRKANDDTLLSTLTGLLQARRPSLKMLWTSLDFESYHALPPALKSPGPAVRAYQALIALGSRSAVDKYAWILRSESVNWVYSLVQVQRRLLILAGRIYDHFPALISRELSREDVTPAVWSFILLYNAKRRANTASTSAKKAGVPGRHEITLELPIDGIAAKAWSQAMAMNKALVLPLLADWQRLMDAPIGKTPKDRPAFHLFCPRLWHKQSHRSLLSPHDESI